MKALGAALVLAAAGGVWLRTLAGQRRELDTLRRLAALLARMGAEIQGRRTPCPGSWRSSPGRSPAWAPA